jgi:4-amino-4-deoxy-L-arabinose transferase-like glycosyltransferase
MQKAKYQQLSLYALLLICLYFVFFQHLDSFHILNWDESMFAVNACEMIRNHNYFVPYYKGVPDMLVLKPPMMIWLQSTFIKLIGYNELAIRLPSAIASSCSALLLFSFIRKRGPLVFALCVFFVFITSFGVCTFHTGRTGDTDALLAFFILCYSISFYKWLFEDNRISLLYFFVFLSLAFLTKSFVSLFFTPALLIMLIYFKRLGLLFKDKWFYIGTILFLVISMGCLLLRDYYNPGYIRYLIDFDFLSRYKSVLDSHNEPFDFYYIQWFEKRFLWLILVIPGAVFMCLNTKLRPAFVFLSLLFLTYFLIISSSVTKVAWYDLPLYPILSIFSGYTLYILISKFNFNQKPSMNALLLFSVFIIPIYFAFRNSAKNDIKNEDKKLEILTEYAYMNKNNESLNEVTFLTNYFDRPLYFYKYKLNTKGMDFKIVNSIDSLKENSLVIVAEDSLKMTLLKKYKGIILEEYKSVLKVKI